MSRYDFEEFLKSEFRGDPQKVLEKYDYQDSSELFERINNTDVSEVETLKDIANAIVLWKIERSISLSDQTIRELKALSAITDPKDALGKNKEQVASVLTHLLESKGFRLAMATTFLHFFNPDVFPILDRRAYRVIFKTDYKDSTSIPKRLGFYFDYLERCIAFHKKVLMGKVSFSEVDKFLYQLDIEIGNELK